MGLNNLTTYSNNDLKIINLTTYSNNDLKKHISIIKKRYKELAKQLHPNKGGTTEKFQELQNCYEKIKKYLNIT